MRAFASAKRNVVHVSNECSRNSFAAAAAAAAVDAFACVVTIGFRTFPFSILPRCVDKRARFESRTHTETPTHTHTHSIEPIYAYKYIYISIYASISRNGNARVCKTPTEEKQKKMTLAYKAVAQ